jgi:hypothetical protein
MENFRKFGPLGIVLFIILIIVGVYFLWIPKYGEYKESQSAFKAKSVESDKKRAYLSEIETKLSALSDYGAELAIINSAIPVYDFSEVALLGYVQKVASEDGLVLKSIEVALKKDEQAPSSVSSATWKIRDLVINATVAGSYGSFKSLLSSIYLNSRLIDVDSINFGLADKEGVVDYDLELNAKYYLWEQASQALAPNI